jgi:putative membrane-bound dehydrogenase-like protein
MIRTILASTIAVATIHATPPFPKEADLLKDVKVAAGFEATLFSAPPQSNYPVFIAASPDGALFVSSDGNGSLGRDKDRGRILRLKDTDGDGRADEVKEFAKIDSPRGLLVHGNTVICMHPPHLSAFIDKNGDGVSDEQKLLVKGLAFDFKGRPADHTTNAIELGIDGWIYIAVGDFGFMEAEGRDGRKLQFRGGGVVRVRPDGSNMQLYSRGTRNILDVAVSPSLDIFSRDNTNDGGGWDIRFHHFSGFEDHGYPRLYMNFGDEIVKPLADYGGGSGCGAAWVDEPGWPAAWNNKPYTSDWGKGPIYRHDVKPKGATFEETAKPEALVKMTRSTDMDVDARGFAYASSWKGPATFGWAGPEHGYIVRVAPVGHVAPKLPDFEKASDLDLVKLLESPSHRTRKEAQRLLLQRGLKKDVVGAVYGLAKNQKAPIASRIAALYTFALGVGEKAAEGIAALAGDPSLSAIAVRALGDFKPVPTTAALKTGLASADARVRNESIIALARAHGISGVSADGGTPQPQQLKVEGLAATASSIAPLLGDSDSVVAHTAMQAMRQFHASDACFAIIDQSGAPTSLRNGALMALRGIHDVKTVDGLISRLAKTKDSTQRQGVLSALCRLHFVEGVWKKDAKGVGDSWGTRPDTRGPFYSPEEWSESGKIAGVLKAALNAAPADEAAFIAKEFSRHRIKLNDATAKLIGLAATDASIVPVLAKQLADSDSIPAEAIPLLMKTAGDASKDDDTVSSATIALTKTDGVDSARAVLAGLANLDDGKRKKKDLNKVRDAFFNSRLAENQHQYLEAEAEKPGTPSSLWADAALLKIAAKKVGSPEPREMAAKSLDQGWSSAKRREQIIRAAILADDKSRAPQIAAALNDPEKPVADAAKDAVKKLKIDPDKVAMKQTGPLIGTLKVEDVLGQIMTSKGDKARGELLFTQVGCVACHTVKTTEPAKGPYLGNIAETYKRRELAEAILVPNKTMAQGFVTNVFTMKDGTIHMGFVTQEAADKVSIRNIAAQETTLDTKLIAKREKNEEQSLMPAGLMNASTVADLASLLDYLEALAKK